MKYLRKIFTIASVLTVCILRSTRARTPTFVTPCSGLTADCIKIGIQQAIPGFMKGDASLGLQVLDPFPIDKVDVVLPGFKMEFRQGKSEGLSKCIVDSAKMEGDNLSVQFRCDLKIKAKYRSEGQFIMFNVNGDGDTSIHCHNLKVRCIFKLGSRVGADGQKYFVIDNFKANHSYDGRVSYRMTNIFKNNPEMTKVVVDFMNLHWRMVAEEFGNPLVEYGVNMVLRNVKELFENVPMNRLVAN